MTLVSVFDQNTSMGELAAGFPILIPLFEARHMDFACGLNQSLADECSRLRLSPESVLSACRTQLEAVPSGEDGSWRKWEDSEVLMLIEHILERYHEGHRAAFPRIEELQERLLNRDCRNPDLMTRLCMLTQWLFDDLRPHMQKEEQVLFPAIYRMMGERPPHGGMAMSCPVQHPIAAMESEHQVAFNVVREIKTLTENFTLHDHSTSDLKALFGELRNLIQEIQRHIHMENNVLFPMVLRLANL